MCSNRRYARDRLDRARTTEAGQRASFARGRARADSQPRAHSPPIPSRQDINDWLASVDATTRVHWALKNLPGPYALSSSFGAQAAVSLHLITQPIPTSRCW
jgi:hypothetical protein